MELKEGYPEEGEVVLATVTGVRYHSAFCTLDEYKDKSGMIHISEVAQGRIRNIEDYLREGKNVVAKVLSIDKKKGHIDLSIRRVTEQQRRQKSSEMKQQQIINNIFEQLSHTTKLDIEKLRADVEPKLIDQLGSVFDAFQAVVDNETTLVELGIDAKTSQALKAAITERIKPREVEIRGELTLQTYAPDGVLLIRQALPEDNEHVDIQYLGAGRYSVRITEKDYKEAEKVLSALTSSVQQSLGDSATVTFDRAKK